MLALQARGLGSVQTTMHLRREGEVAELLVIPRRQHPNCTDCVVHYTGKTFSPASRPQPV